MITYSNPNFKDLDEITDLYLKTFSSDFEKLNFKLSKNQVKDVLKLYLLTDSNGFFIARDNQSSKIIGFMISVTSMNKVWFTLLTKQIHKSLLFIFSKRAPLITPPYVSYWNLGHLPAEGISVDYRGKGIAKELAIKAIDYLKSKGVKAVLFEALKENKAIINLYEKLGFKVVKEFSHRKFSWIILLKDL